MLTESIESLLKEAFSFGVKKRVELGIGALLCMDSERRMKALGDGVKNIILTLNEARKSENLPPVEDGDFLFLQQQNFSLVALAKCDTSEDPFTKETQQIQTATAPVGESGKSLSKIEFFAMKTMFRGLLTK